jgi:hypothetical protein
MFYFLVNLAKSKTVKNFSLQAAKDSILGGN